MVRGVSRVNYKIPRLFQVARRCSKVFQKFSASLVLYELEMFKVCRDDMPYMISYCSIVGGVREQLLVSSGRHIYCDRKKVEGICCWMIYHSIIPCIL